MLERDVAKATDVIVCQLYFVFSVGYLRCPAASHTAGNLESLYSPREHALPDDDVGLFRLGDEVIALDHSQPLDLREPWTTPEAMGSASLTGMEQPSLDLVVDVTSNEPILEFVDQAGLLGGLHSAPRWQLRMKRAIDIVGVVLILIPAAPLMLLTALGIAITSPGPVLFSQERVGYRGERFMFLKFRSMCHDAETRRAEVLDQNHHGSGPIFKIRDDPRMTRVGKVIRRFSIDELPQLFHVLRGRMSLVGPRPLPYSDLLSHIPEDHLSDTSKYTTRDLQRLFAKPGITCIWQVSGRSEIDYDTWVKMDIEYIESWSLGLDLKLLARTVPAVLSGRGAY